MDLINSRFELYAGGMIKTNLNAFSLFFRQRNKLKCSQVLLFSVYLDSKNVRILLESVLSLLLMDLKGAECTPLVIFSIRSQNCNEHDVNLIIVPNIRNDSV